MRRNTVLLGLCDRLPNYTRQIQIRFGRYQLGQNSNREADYCHCRFESRLPGGRMARSIPENQKRNLSYLGR